MMDITVHLPSVVYNLFHKKSGTKSANKSGAANTSGGAIKTKNNVKPIISRRITQTNYWKICEIYNVIFF